MKWPLDEAGHYIWGENNLIWFETYWLNDLWRNWSFEAIVRLTAIFLRRFCGRSIEQQENWSNSYLDFICLSLGRWHLIGTVTERVLSSPESHIITALRLTIIQAAPKSWGIKRQKRFPKWPALYDLGCWVVIQNL